MIYLVTLDKELFDNSEYKIIGVDESLLLLTKLSIVGLDTETSGLDPYIDSLLSVQLGCYEYQVVIDCTTIDILKYKEYFESDRLFIGWNLKFDIKWLYRYGIILKKVYDGFLAEKLMWLGYPAGVHSMSLKSAALNYLDVKLDKSIRGKIIWNGLRSLDTIIYAAKDVQYLEKIMECQKEELKKKDLLRAVEYENRFVLPLAYCEYCGVKLSVAKWKAKMEKDKERELRAKKACDEWLLKNEPNSKYIFVDRQGDFWEGFHLEPQVNINWNSAKQLAPLFKKYGVEIQVEDREKGGMKDSIDAKTLKPQKDKCSLIPLYLEYKEAVKVTSTYGENFLKQINPVSGRIHSNINQLGTDTGRLSSGGKDKATGKEYINLQNLPADAETRACFIAEELNAWVSIDYTGEESFLMASIANDEAMINELMYGEKDLHTLTAKIIFPQIPKDMPAKEVKKKFHDERSRAKGYEFAFNYNGNANTIMRNFGLSEEEANRIYNAYMSGFDGLKRYQEYKHKDWWNKGYILISELSGHKAYIYDYERLKEDKEWMKTLDWDYYREMKKSNPDCSTVQRVKHFFKRKSASDKQSSNYEIQGTGALIFKVASVYFWNKILENNWFNKVKLCIPVHDEWNIEAPKEIAEEVAQTLYNCMIKAGKFFCTRCKLDAEISRLEDGSLPIYWIH